MRPWGVLSQDDMVAVLLDVHIAEAAMKVVDTSAKRIEKQEYYNTVFEKHRTTKEQFDKEIEKGMAGVKAGRVYSADAIEAEMKMNV